MTTEFLSQDIWPQLSKAVRGCRQRCDVAVAYFGAGASRLLPLPDGSRLVVDASERAVTSGQTCPADLLKLVKRGVIVYSVPNLHAKVFVIGRAAFVGSTNVSSRSAAQLVEATIRTTEPGAVREARQFVRKHCIYELTPGVLEQLAKLYRPPQIPAGKRGKNRATETSRRSTLPRVLLAQLKPIDWPERDLERYESGLVVAKQRRQHSRSFELDSFRWSGQCNYRRRDVVIQVTDEGNGKVLVSPPGNVLNVRPPRNGIGGATFVYLEQPVTRRRQVKSLALALGCAEQRLRRSGLIRDPSLAKALLRSWAVNP